MIKKININWLSVESIKKAQREKARLENKGYKLLNTININSDKATLIYEDII